MAQTIKHIVKRTKSQSRAYGAATDRKGAAKILRETRKGVRKKYPGALIARGVASGNRFNLEWEKAFDRGRSGR